MLVVMQHGASQSDVDRVVRTIEELGYQARPMPGTQRTAVGLVGNDGRVDSSRIEALPGVSQVIHVSQPYKQVSRECPRLRRVDRSVSEPSSPGARSTRAPRNPPA